MAHVQLERAQNLVYRSQSLNVTVKQGQMPMTHAGPSVLHACVNLWSAERTYTIIGNLQRHT